MKWYLVFAIARFLTLAVATFSAWRGQWDAATFFAVMTIAITLDVYFSPLVKQ